METEQIPLRSCGKVTPLPFAAGIFASLSISGALNGTSSGFCLNSSGQVAFRAGIDTNNDGTVDEYGIYFFNGTQLQQVARTNDTLAWEQITALQFAGTHGTLVGLRPQNVAV